MHRTRVGALPAGTHVIEGDVGATEACEVIWPESMRKPQAPRPASVVTPPERIGSSDQGQHEVPSSSMGFWVAMTGEGWAKQADATDRVWAFLHGLEHGGLGLRRGTSRRGEPCWRGRGPAG